MAVTTKSPLYGKKVVVTRSLNLGNSFKSRLEQLGAVPLSVPALDIAPTLSIVEGLLRTDLAWCDWILLTSPSVISTWAKNTHFRKTIECNWRIAVLGPPSAHAYQRFFGKAPNFAYDWKNSGTLADQMQLQPSQHFLVLGSNQRPGPTLAELLVQHPNCRFRQVIQVSCSPSLGSDLALLANGFDAIAFTSSSGVQCFMQALLPIWHGGMDTDEICFTCIGSATAAALQEWGISAKVVCRSPTEADMISGMSLWFAQQEPSN